MNNKYKICKDATVNQLIYTLENSFNINIKRKKDEIFPIIGGIVEQFSDISKQEFVDNYTQTIYKNIYLSKSLALSNSVYVLLPTLIHELVHVSQFSKDHLMPISYLVNSSERALLEAEANVGNISIKYALMDYDCNDEDKDSVINYSLKKISKYGCDQDDLDAAEGYLTSAWLTLTKAEMLPTLFLDRVFETLESANIIQEA